MTGAHQDPLGLIGKTIADKYQIRGVAGDGGFSTVYRAEHLIWKQDVAIKCFTVLQNANAELRDRLLEDFIQEGKLMSELSSRSAAIVQARDIGKLDVGEGEWIPFMVLEWLDGSPLDLLLNRERAHGVAPRNLIETLTLLEPVAAAVDIAHKRNVAHRDLKPANIMIIGDARGSDVSVKVLDFGIAKVIEEGLGGITRGLTQTNGLLGTVAFMAPEQARGGTIDARTDIYAFGVVLYQMLAGHVPFKGNNPFMVLERHVNEAPTPLVELDASIPKDADALVLRCLEKRPEDRFGSMAEVLNALENFTTQLLPGSSPPVVVDTATFSGVQASLRDIATPWAVPVVEDPSQRTARYGAPPTSRTAPDRDTAETSSSAPPKPAVAQRPTEVSSRGSSTQIAAPINPPSRRNAGVMIAVGLGMIAALGTGALTVHLLMSSADRPAESPAEEAVTPPQQPEGSVPPTTTAPVAASSKPTPVPGSASEPEPELASPVPTPAAAALALPSEAEAVPKPKPKPIVSPRPRSRRARPKDKTEPPPEVEPASELKQSPPPSAHSDRSDPVHPDLRDPYARQQ